MLNGIVEAVYGGSLAIAPNSAAPGPTSPPTGASPVQDTARLQDSVDQLSTSVQDLTKQVKAPAAAPGQQPPNLTKDQLESLKQISQTLETQVSGLKPAVASRILGSAIRRSRMVLCGTVAQPALKVESLWLPGQFAEAERVRQFIRTAVRQYPIMIRVTHPIERTFEVKDVILCRRAGGTSFYPKIAIRQTETPRFVTGT